jgi:hypothetical protein
MSSPMILLPVFVLVGLTFVVFFWTGSGRGPAAGRSAAAVEETLFDPLQLSMLFYVLVALASPLRHMDFILVALSWVFVVIRFFHAGVFVTSSNARNRSLTYYSGALVLLAMWLYFALRILFYIY